MNLQATNPDEPSIKPDDSAPVASRNHDRMAITGLKLTLAASAASGVVVILVAVGIIQGYWRSAWLEYGYPGCVATAGMGWLISIAAFVRRRTKSTGIVVFKGFIALLIVAAFYLLLVITRGVRDGLSL